MAQQRVPSVKKEDAAALAERDATRQQDTERGRREAKTKAREDKLDELDELLDEIDGLLEENASEVLAAYRQRGGQASIVERILDSIIAGILVRWNTVKELTTIRPSI